MRRRAFLATSSAAIIGAAAGCLTDEVVREFGGHDITFLPVDEVYDIWEEGDALFLDSRGIQQYASRHIQNAEPSPAPDGLGENDPTNTWPEDEQIITYCPCPYQLSGQRAANLKDQGYESVNGLDEGFQSWIDEGYPLGSGLPEEFESAAHLEGWTEPGDYVTVRAPSTGQETMVKADADGYYEVGVPFTGITPHTKLEVRTAEYAVSAPVSDLEETTITAALA